MEARAAALDRLGVGFLLAPPFGDGPAQLRQIAVHRVMGAGLVGHDVGADAAPASGAQFGEDIGGIADQATDFASPALVQRSIIASASSSVLAFSST
jgi:hypothetical protein